MTIKHIRLLAVLLVAQTTHTITAEELKARKIKVHLTDSKDIEVTSQEFETTAIEKLLKFQYPYLNDAEINQFAHAFPYSNQEILLNLLSETPQDRENILKQAVLYRVWIVGTSNMWSLKPIKDLMINEKNKLLNGAQHRDSIWEWRMYCDHHFPIFDELDCHNKDEKICTRVDKITEHFINHFCNR